jgi:hypothetical protein
VLLWEIRQQLLSTELEAELRALYADRPRGRPPVAPGQLLLATLLPAYTGLSDADVVEAIVADRRWQLVLACWDAKQPPFSQATLVHFRRRLIAANLDRRVLERVLELAEARSSFGRKSLKLALDSSPLWGAGRVEDIVNLLGTAARRAVAVLAKLSGHSVGVQATALGVPELCGASLKGTLDLDWTEAEAQTRTLTIVLGALATIEAAVPAPPLPVAAHLAAGHQVVARDRESGYAGAAGAAAGGRAGPPDQHRRCRPASWPQEQIQPL